MLVANNCINVPKYVYFYFRGSALKILQKIGLGKEKGKYVPSLSRDVVSTTLNHLLGKAAQ
ncbi:hypothetical protein CJ263_17080 [Maribacter cobaltidurans]|uniref:Uncharacterized protein n=1 Tax=Maribacter cobaltidurans TaxID=1178778 RepID=A0A223V9H9_9FLAO|nr:hypothetical protein CJ263_17080 [Maribacter cobaltidurans]